LRAETGVMSIALYRHGCINALKTRLININAFKMTLLSTYMYNIGRRHIAIL